MSRRKRPKIEPTDDWELLLPLFAWPEQQVYEELRPVALFGASVPSGPGRSASRSGRCTAGSSVSRRTAC
jgi:hypothetical protein